MKRTVTKTAKKETVRRIRIVVEYTPASLETTVSGNDKSDKIAGHEVVGLLELAKLEIIKINNNN